MTDQRYPAARLATTVARVGEHGPVTDLLARPRPAGADRPAEQPLPLVAPLAGVSAAVGSLLVCCAVALVGWFAADAGAHGSTRDALRVGADAWLLGHGADLALGAATVGVVPLALTLLAGAFAWRAGRRLGSREQVIDEQSAALAVGLFALAYAVVAVAVAVLASTSTARPDSVGALLGGAAVAVVFGGGGVIRGAGLGHDLLARLPEPARVGVVGALRCAAATVLALLAASAALVAGSWAVSFGTAATLLDALDLSPADLAALTLVTVLLVPNLLVLGAAYLLGPGFAVGVGTSVAPGGVELGDVPALPVMAALPDPGSQPGALGLVLAVPALCAVGAAVLVLRRGPVPRYEDALATGVGGGVLAGSVLGVLAALGSGPLGPGTMAEVGPAAGPVVAAACVALGLGGGLGAAVVTWWRRRTLDGAPR